MAKGFLDNIEAVDDPYAVGWNGNLEVPTKNAIYDKIESLGGGGGTTTVTANTGTAISLANNAGNLCNLRTADTANANTTFTTTGGVAGGWARVLINTTSQPTITGATLQQGSDWITGTDMYMDVWSDGTDEYYNFVSVSSTALGLDLNELGDVTITTVATGEIMVKSATDWVNQTLAEAGISAVGHNHDTETIVVGDHGAAATDEVVNVCYGTSATPPTASTTTEGTLYIQYTA